MFFKADSRYEEVLLNLYEGILNVTAFLVFFFFPFCAQKKKKVLCVCVCDSVPTRYTNKICVDLVVINFCQEGDIF